MLRTLKYVKIHQQSNNSIALIQLHIKNIFILIGYTKIYLTTARTATCATVSVRRNGAVKFILHVRMWRLKLYAVVNILIVCALWTYVYIHACG